MSNWANISTHSLTRRLTECSLLAVIFILKFQLTASQGGWLMKSGSMQLHRYFNSQPHKEADRIHLHRRYIFLEFQLTASQGGWPLLSLTAAHAPEFQLTASQGGWRNISPRKLTPNHFNSQPHKEADHLWRSCRKIPCISTHSLTRRLTDCRLGNPCILAFQLTASQGGWRLYALIFGSRLNFNSQPHKEADDSYRICWKALYYFNSQPHKEADISSNLWYSVFSISTHSLTRRLTWLTMRNGIDMDISTHSLTRRLTVDFPEVFARRAISTHSLTRRLTAECNRLQVWIFISTHSLTRRLTKRRARRDRAEAFQLTASQGGWQQLDRPLDTITTFQLTASQGGWRTFKNMWTVWRYFNSQPHKEADGSLRRCLIFRLSFQLTASQGGWLCHLIYWSRENVFQLTASQGGWRIWMDHWFPGWHFNSQPHKEADL